MAGPAAGQPPQPGCRFVVEVLDGDRGQGREDRQQGRVGPADLGQAGGAAFGVDAGDVGRQARRLEARQVGVAALPGLHLAHDELSEIGAKRSPAAEPEVDHDQGVVVAGEEVGGARVAVRGGGGGVVEFVKQRRERICRGEQAVAEPRVERVADQWVRPYVVPGQRGQHDVREPRAGVDAGGPRAVDRGRQRRHSAAGGEPAQQVRRPGVPSEVPDDPPGRHVLQPQRRRIGVQVPHSDGAGDGEAGRQPVSQVRAVQVGLDVPGDEGGGLGAQVRGDREPQRRALVGMDDLDEQGEGADLAGAGPGGPGDQVVSRGGDRGPVVREDLGR